MTEPLHPESRAEWLAMRRQDVTASEVAALFPAADHPRKTAYSLWLAKCGREETDEEDTPAMERGRMLEPIALELLRRRLPAAKITGNFGARVLYYRDHVRRIGATPDCLVFDPDRGFGTVQAKSIEPGIFRAKWRHEDGTIEPPLWVGIQALTEAMLCGASWAAVAPLRVGFGLDFDLIDVPLNRSLWTTIEDRVADFWRLVHSETPPPPDYNRDGRLIAELYPTDNGATVDLSHDNAFVAAVANRVRLKADMKAIDVDLEALEAEIRHKVGDHQRAIAGDYVVTLKLQHTKEHVRAASTSRPMRIRSRGG